MKSKIARKLTSSKEPLFLYNKFLDSYHELGLSSQQAMMVIQQVRYWRHEHNEPYVSNTTVARRMGVSVRTVRAWEKDLEKKGLLWREARFDKGRQTSSVLHYGPLLQTLRGVNEEVPQIRDARIPRSPTTRIQGSYHEEKESTEVDLSPNEKRENDERTSSRPPDPLNPERPELFVVPTSLLKSRESAARSTNPKHTTFSFSPKDITEADVGTKEELEAQMEAITAKTTKQVDANARKREARYDRKRERAQADQTLSSREQKKVDRMNLAMRWRELMGVHFPNKRLPKYGPADFGKFERFLDNWDYEHAMRLIEFSIPGWKKLTGTWKNAPTSPTLGYFLAVAESFMEVADAQLRFAEAKARFEEWSLNRNLRDLMDPPKEISEPYREAREILTKAGFKPEDD